MLLIKLIRTKPVVQGFIQRKGKSVFRHADKKNRRNLFCCCCTVDTCVRGEWSVNAKKGIFQYIQTGCLITWQLQQAWVLLMVSRVTQITAQSFSISYSLLYSRISSPSRKGQTESQTRQERSSSPRSTPPTMTEHFPFLPPPPTFLHIAPVWGPLLRCFDRCKHRIADNKPLCMFLIALILGWRLWQII